MRKIYRTCIFNMACAATYEYDCTPFPSRPGNPSK